MTYRRWLTLEVVREIAGLLAFLVACGAIVYGLAVVCDRIGRF